MPLETTVTYFQVQYSDGHLAWQPESSKGIVYNLLTGTSQHCDSIKELHIGVSTEFVVLAGFGSNGTVLNEL